MKTVRLLCHRNGVGLSWDGEIIRGLLKSHGYSVQWDDPNWKDRGSGSFDLVIHCEIVYPGYMSAPKRIFIPNPEWFYPDWKRHLKDYTVIACKTKDAQRIFQKLNCPTRHVSFTSQDRYDPDVEKKLKFVHFAGQSYNKGTTETLRAFGQGGSPKLNVFSRDPTTFKWVAGVNAEIHVGSLSDEQMKLEQNSNAVHLCCSSYEGFGHYINEAKSCKAVIITTNAPPMNEMVSWSFGFGCSSERPRRQNMAMVRRPRVASIYENVMYASHLDADGIRVLGERARESYLRNDLYFKERFMNLVYDLIGK